MIMVFTRISVKAPDIIKLIEFSKKIFFIKLLSPESFLIFKNFKLKICQKTCLNHFSRENVSTIDGIDSRSSNVVY